MSVLLWVVGCGLWALDGGLQPARSPAPRQLFDGTSLKGWREIGPGGKFRVEDGEIRAESDSPCFLVTERDYADFELTLELKADAGANSGIQVRSRLDPKGAMVGYQVEVDTSEQRWSGGIYDAGRRGWLQTLDGNEAGQAAFRVGDWNRYRIRCVADRLQVWVNDVPTADLRDSVDLRGVIALQHHGEAGKRVSWRELSVTDLGHSEWRPLFDGESMAGWESNGVGEWTVKDGLLIGRSPASEPRHGLLASDTEYTDFTVRVQFRAIAGNSGFYFRTELDQRPAGCAGFQAEIDPVDSVGGLYETYGRGWVVRPSADEVGACLKADDWNTMTVAAHGRDVAVHLNGRCTAQLLNDPGRVKGRFALQLHGGQDMHVRFREIAVLESIPPSDDED